MNEAIAELQEAVNKLRVAVATYNKLLDSEKKAVRHALYTKTGKFGKALLNTTILDDYKTIEDELKAKNES